MQYYYMKIFFWWEKGFHRRFQTQTGDDECTSPTVGARITAGSGTGLWTGGDGPAITIDLNSTVPKTVGDALLEPAVIGVAVVVLLNPDNLDILALCSKQSQSCHRASTRGPNQWEGRNEINAPPSINQ